MFGMNLLGEKDYPTPVLGGRQSDNAAHKKTRSMSGFSKMVPRRG